jgi:hypothetical protein
MRSRRILQKIDRFLSVHIHCLTSLGAREATIFSKRGSSLQLREKVFQVHGKLFVNGCRLRFGKEFL